MLHAFDNPFDAFHHVCVVFDPFHLLKNIRNNFKPSKTALFPGGQARWRHIKELLQMESKDIGCR